MFIKPKYLNDKILIATSTKTDNNLRDDFFNAVDVDSKKAMFMNQTHSSNVKKVTILNSITHRNKKGFNDTDALITNIKNIPLVVKTADCLPIVLHCRKSNSIACIHAGWRGIVGGIVKNTVEMMIKNYKASPKDIYVFLAPRIFLENYEVGIEVSDLFQSKIYKGQSCYIDIAKETILQLVTLGIGENNIEDSKLNTYTDDRFYSYRRDGENSGRIYTLAMLR